LIVCALAGKSGSQIIRSGAGEDCEAASTGRIKNASDVDS
jgi:hypothetical protein